MNILQRLFKSKPKTEDRVFRTHQDFVFWLTAGWLLVTFEHIYYTLSQYSLHTVWDISGMPIPISDITIFALVILLEVTLFWSVMFIPAAKILKVRKFVMYTIQGIGITISMFLNIKYMVMASPTDSNIDIAIGAIIGGLIPIFVVLFGYVEGQLVDSRQNKEMTIVDVDEDFAEALNTTTIKVGKSEPEKPRIDRKIVPEPFSIEDKVTRYKKKNQHKSIREIAEEFDISREEVQRYLDEGRQYET